MNGSQKDIADWCASMLRNHPNLLVHQTRKLARAKPAQREVVLGEFAVAAWLARMDSLVDLAAFRRNIDPIFDLRIRLAKNAHPLALEVKSDRNDIEDLVLLGTGLHDRGLRDVILEAYGPDYGIGITWSHPPDPTRIGRHRRHLIESMNEELDPAPEIPPGGRLNVNVHFPGDPGERSLSASIRIQRPPFVTINSRLEGEGWGYLFSQVLDHARSKDNTRKNRGDTEPFVLAYHRFDFSQPRFDSVQLAWAAREGLLERAPRSLRAVLLIHQKLDKGAIQTSCTGVARGSFPLDALVTAPLPALCHRVTAGEAWERLIEAVANQCFQSSTLVDEAAMLRLHERLRSCDSPECPDAAEVLQMARGVFAVEGRLLRLFRCGEYLPAEWVADTASAGQGLPCPRDKVFQVDHRQPRPLRSTEIGA